MFFDKDRIQLLGLFDFLPLTDEDVDSNLTLIDYRLTVRDLQIAYIKNVILKMLGGQAQFGPGTPISDYFSSTGLSQVLGSTLSGEEGSEIYNRLDEVLYSNQIFQNAVKQLSQVKLDPTSMAAEAVFYWDGSGLENIPTQSDLEDFFGNYCNITGTPNTQENFDNTPVSKMYLQLLIDTQSSINHYYPSMLGLTRYINPASYICSKGLQYDASIGSTPIVAKLALSQDLPSSDYGSRLQEYSLMQKARIGGVILPGTIDAESVKGISQDFLISNTDEINTAAILQILSRELTSSGRLTPYQGGTIPFTKVDYAKNNQNFDFNFSPVYEYAHELKLLNDSQEDTLTDSSKGLLHPDNPSMATTNISLSGKVFYEDANLGNITRVSTSKSAELRGEKNAILTFETSDVNVSISGISQDFKSGINGLIKIALNSDLRATLLDNPNTSQLNETFSSIVEFENPINEIIDNNIQFIKDMSGIDLENSVEALGLYDKLLEKVITLYSGLESYGSNPVVAGGTITSPDIASVIAAGGTVESTVTGEIVEVFGYDKIFTSDYPIQTAFIIEMIKKSKSYPKLEQALTKWFWHYFNGYRLGSSSVSVDMSPEIGDINYEDPNDSVDYLRSKLSQQDIAGISLPSLSLELSQGAKYVVDALYSVMDAGFGIDLSKSKLTDKEGVTNYAFLNTSDLGQVFVKENTTIEAAESDRGTSLITGDFAIDRTNYNPFYQMSQFLIEVLELTDDIGPRGTYWREFDYDGGDTIKVTRRGAFDIKVLCYYVFKLFQNIFAGINATESEITRSESFSVAGIATSTYSSSGLSVITKTGLDSIVSYLQNLKDSIRNDSVELSFPNRENYAYDFGLIKAKLKEEELNLRKTVAFIDQFRLTDTITELNSFLSTNYAYTLRSMMAQQATTIAGAEYELTVIPEINSGQAQLANLTKARLLPNLKFATNTISEARPVSLLSSNEIISKGTKNALLNLMNDQRLKDSAESEFNPKNSKIVMCGLPTGFIDEIRFPKIYVTDANASYFVSQNYDENQSIVNVRYEKNDMLVQDVVFESIKLSFDTRLIVAPNGFDNCDFNEGSPSLLNEIINDRIRFQMLNIVPSSESLYQDVDGDGFNEHGKVYSDLVSDPKYAELTEEKIQSILLNCATSEILKRYLQIIVGVKLGEENFPMSNTFKSQLVDNSIGIDGGIPVIDVLESMFNISGLNLSLDPLIIENLLTADSKVAKETEFSESVSSSPVLANLNRFSLPSNPTVEAAGASVSQVQQVSQLLSSAFFRPYALMGECIAPKMFESILFAIIDPDEFVVDENATNADIIYDLENIGIAVRSSIDGKLRILRTDDNNASSSNLNEYFVTCNVADISDIKTLEEVSAESGRPTETTRR